MRFTSQFPTGMGRGFWGTLIICFSLLDGGCGTWIGNPDDPEEEEQSVDGGNSHVSLDVKGEKPNEAALVGTEIEVTHANGSAGGSLDLTSAQVVLEEIELEADSASVEGRDDETDFKGPYVADLLNDTLTPTPEQAKVPAGIYEEIELKMAKLGKKEAKKAGLSKDNPLVGKSILLSGTYTAPDGEQKSFKMTFELGEEFELLDTDDGVEIVAHEVNPLVIAFQLDQWFDFSDPETNPDGYDFRDVTASEIVLSKDSDSDAAKELHDAIKESIKDSADFEKEKDGA